VVLLVDGLLEAGLGLPWDVYTDWWREKTYGFTAQPFGGWLFEWALMGVISVLATVVLLTLIYALVRRAPRTWWLWSGALTSLFVLIIMGAAPTIMSLFNEFTPAPPGPVRDAVVELAKANGVPSDKIYIFDGSKQSSRYTANVTGVGGTAQISMSDVMFQKGADMAEVRAVVGHEMGHYVHQHLFWFAGVYGLLALVGSLLIDRLFAPVLPFVTEEVWSWWKDGSVHTSSCPTADEVPATGDVDLMSDVSAALVELRGVKSTHKVPMRTPILSARISAPASVIANLKAVESDLTKVSKTESLTFLAEGDELILEAELGEPPAKRKK